MKMMNISEIVHAQKIQQRLSNITIKERDSMKIDIREGCMYIELNGWTYYIDDSTNEQIIEKWKKGTEEEQCLQY